MTGSICTEDHPGYADSCSRWPGLDDLTCAGPVLYSCTNPAAWLDLDAGIDERHFCASKRSSQHHLVHVP